MKILLDILAKRENQLLDYLVNQVSHVIVVFVVDVSAHVGR